MSTRFFKPSLAAALVIALVVPTAFFVGPQKTYAVAPVGVPTRGIGPNEFTTSAKSVFLAIKSALTTISSATTAAASYANMINAYVLQPLAFVLSGNLMKMMTASVVGFVIGKANGTGVPQFVVDVRKSMQTVADSQALAYLSQVNQTNSPFAYSISSALNTDYLTKSSLLGFWDANLCTLSAASPDAPAYLQGSWSQGGVAAWFALTTQSQNNPYSLYENTKSQLGAVVGSGAGGVTDVRKEELAWGQGFMSWCGADEGSSSAAAGDTAVGVNPGDACIKDGVSGTIKTPGTVIKATLDKVLGGQQDEIVRMGNIGPQINSILGDIGTVMKTVNFASSLLGGSGSGGLFGADQTSSTNSTSRLSAFTPTQDASGGFTTGYLGASNTQIAAEAAASAATAANSVDPTASVAEAAAPVNSSGGTVATDLMTRASDYQTAWGTISVAARSASAAIGNLVSVCTSYGNYGQVTAAQVALSNQITPVFTTAAGVPDLVAAMLAQETLVKSLAATSSTYAVELQKLQNMQPTFVEVAAAKYDATSYGAATASPTGSLTVSGGSLVDRMNLIRTNADALQISACMPPQSIINGGR